jgi:hypothetical protein
MTNGPQSTGTEVLNLNRPLTLPPLFDCRIPTVCDVFSDILTWQMVDIDSIK